MSSFDVHVLIYHKGSILKGSDGDCTFSCDKLKCVKFDSDTGFDTLKGL